MLVRVGNRVSIIATAIGTTSVKLSSDHILGLN